MALLLGLAELQQCDEAPVQRTPAGDLEPSQPLSLVAVVEREPGGTVGRFGPGTSLVVLRQDFQPSGGRLHQGQELRLRLVLVRGQEVLDDAAGQPQAEQVRLAGQQLVVDILERVDLVGLRMHRPDAR